jgi:hypothetical protein
MTDRILKSKGRTKSVDWKGLVVDSLYLRDMGICQLCNKGLTNDHLFEIDHIIERSEGGKDTLQNLRLVHLECHKKRHAEKRLLLPDIAEITSADDFQYVKEYKKTSIKKSIHVELLSRLRLALLKTRSITEASFKIGITNDQARYYLGLYDLNWKTPDKWSSDYK